jgi:hypothetical protein
MTTIDVNQLFNSAQQDGTLSTQSMQVLNVPDLGAAIQCGLGIAVDDVKSSEVVLVTLMPDDSGSIRMAKNAQNVRDGHNAVLDALAASKQKDNVFVHTRYLNGHVLFPYVPLAQAVRMDAQNYDPNQGTPLYDQTVVLLGTVLAKTQSFLDAGVSVRTVTLLITDGADAGSSQAGAKEVASLVHDMRVAERHVVAAMGIDDGSTDFRGVFAGMGIEPRWVLTPKNDPKDIRRAFNVFSQSAVQLSQGQPAPAAGGFGAHP